MLKRNKTKKRNYLQRNSCSADFFCPPEFVIIRVVVGSVRYRRRALNLSPMKIHIISRRFSGVCKMFPAFSSLKRAYNALLVESGLTEPSQQVLKRWKRADYTNCKYAVVVTMRLEGSVTIREYPDGWQIITYTVQ